MARFLLGFAIVTASWQTYAAGDRPMEHSSGSRALHFTVQAEKHEYRRGESIILKGGLENQGPAPLLINKQLFIKSSQVEAGGWGVALKVIDPSGQQVPLGWFYEMTGPAREWFVELEPGESYTSDLQGDIGPSCKEGGVYRITASYYNFVGDSLDLNPWKGVVESNTLEVKITQ